MNWKSTAPKERYDQQLEDKRWKLKSDNTY